MESMYAQAQNNWLRSHNLLLRHDYGANESCYTSLSDLQEHIDAFSNFLASVAELARSKWTEFDLKMMGIGLGTLLFSLVIHLVAIEWANNLLQLFYHSVIKIQFSMCFISALFVVAIRGFSFLSNSYILREGKVASYLLATAGIISLRDSISRNMSIEFYQLKQQQQQQQLHQCSSAWGRQVRPSSAPQQQQIPINNGILGRVCR